VGRGADRAVPTQRTPDNAATVRVGNGKEAVAHPTEL
jgi:hypothetical protein